MKHPSILQSATRHSAQSLAEQLLEKGEHSALLIIDHTQQAAMEALAQVDHIFADADGTIVNEGTEAFLPDKIELIQQLARLGVGITIVTGKPLAEVVPLRQSLPNEVPINFICEKGAYDVHFDTTGAWREFILSSAEQEQSVAELREQFTDFGKQLVNKYGSDKLGFGWGGSGEHKSALSIDLFAGKPPKDYLTLRGGERNALKLKDASLIEQVEQAITNWAQEQRPDWRIVHLGNANIEITPAGIGKSEAIIESAEFGAARKVLILGDSFNDRGMFNLRRKFTARTLNSLVIHRKTSLPLVDLADFVTFGMANGNPILQATLAAHKL